MLYWTVVDVFGFGPLNGPMNLLLYFHTNIAHLSHDLLFNFFCCFHDFRGIEVSELDSLETSSFVTICHNIILSRDKIQT